MSAADSLCRNLKCLFQALPFLRRTGPNYKDVSPQDLRPMASYYLHVPLPKSSKIFLPASELIFKRWAFLFLIINMLIVTFWSNCNNLIVLANPWQWSLDVRYFMDVNYGHDVLMRRNVSADCDYATIFMGSSLCYSPSLSSHSIFNNSAKGGLHQPSSFDLKVLKVQESLKYLVFSINSILSLKVWTDKKHCLVCSIWEILKHSPKNVRRFTWTIQPCCLNTWDKNPLNMCIM